MKCWHSVVSQATELYHLLCGWCRLREEVDFGEGGCLRAKLRNHNLCFLSDDGVCV
jgi:hypothetical protein